MKKEDVVDGLEGCGLRVEIVIGNFVEKLFMKIKEDDSLWMYD